MSQRAALRGTFLCILALVTAFPVAAQITFSPSTVTFAVGETSAPITANITFTSTGPLPGGLQTLRFGVDYVLPQGITTVPSPVTFTTAPGQTTASVTFRLVAAPWAYTGPTQLPAGTTPNYAFGVLAYTVDPVSVAPAAATVVPGGTSNQLTATVGYGFAYVSGPQQLVFSGLPRGASPSPNPVTFTPSYTVQTPWATVGFRISASAATPPGRYVVGVGADIPFIGAARGGTVGPLVVVSDTFVLTVQAPGSLGVTPEKASIDVCPGGPPVANSVVVEALDGYSGTPTVTFPSLPPDLKVNLTSIPLDAMPPSATAAFEISALPGALPGPKIVTVLAKDPYGPSGSATFVVNVGAGDFAPALAPAAVALASGGPAVSLSAGIAPGSCSPPERIKVTPTNLPPGVTATPASAEIVAPAYAPVVFSLVASSGAPAAAVEAVVLYETAAGDARPAPFPLTVSRNGRIGVALERPSVDVCPGGAGGPNSLTISSIEGYAGTPTVTFPDLPAGITVSPAGVSVPIVPPSRLVSFTVNAAPGTPAGPTTVKVLVSDPGGLSTSVTFVANVLPGEFTPMVAPDGVTLNAGGASGALGVTLLPGACAPSAGVVVTPSGLPPGVTVSPSSAVLSPPAFEAASFAFRAAPAAAPGTTTVTFSFVPAGGGATKTVTATVTVCGPPPAPVSPVVKPKGNPSGPVTATDFLALSWGAPASGFLPTRYEWRINGGEWAGVAATTATAPPRGKVDPVQLFVRGYACDPEKGPGPEASSPVYSLAAPVASFSFPTPVLAGTPVTFTDTSSPQATSWLWFPGDGTAATTVQSPTVTFPSTGPKVVVLVATNGSGSSTKSVTVNVLPAFASVASASVGVRAMDRQLDGRLALGRVEVEPGTTLVLRRLEGEGEAVAFLRLVDADGNVVVERRLVVAEGEVARHDLSAWGASGALRVEVVGPEGLEAVVEERAIRFGGPDEPVKPVRPGGVLLK